LKDIGSNEDSTYSSLVPESELSECIQMQNSLNEETGEKVKVNAEHINNIIKITID